MQSQPICGHAPQSTTAGELVRVARSLGDGREVPVAVGHLMDVHFARCEGGTRAPLPEPTLAGFVLCSCLPVGLPFGHSCLHGPAPHRIKVLVSDATDETLRDRLRAGALTQSAMRRRRRRAMERAARRAAVAAAGEEMAA